MPTGVTSAARGWMVNVWEADLVPCHCVVEVGGR